MANQVRPQRAVNVANRSRKLGQEQPFARWTDTQTGWRVTLLKSYQVDNGKQYARWFTWVDSEFSEYGDQYVASLWKGLRYADDLEFDTTIWPTRTQFLEWAQGTGG